mgnify:CR=1 FL=1
MFVCLLLTSFVAVSDARNPLPGRIDKLIVAGHADYAKVAAPLADDAEFVRRVYLDLTGTIPTVDEARKFLDDKSQNKRTPLINSLLSSAGHVRRMVWYFDVLFMDCLLYTSDAADE